MSELDDFAELAASGLFDNAWYLEQHPDVRDAKLDPLLHYFRFGAAEGRKPNAYFDPLWYRALAGIDDATEPLLHYMREGERAGLSPSRYVDLAWYREAYALGDEDSPLADLIAHARARLPCAELYAVSRPLAAGRADPVTDFIATHTEPGESLGLDRPVIAQSGLFDAQYYLGDGSDDTEASLDPAEHFCRFGWHEGRNPNLYFDTRWYLKTNPEVARLGINPLVHYILEGESAGRRPIVYFDPVWYRSVYEIPHGTPALAHFLEHCRDQLHSPNPHFDLTWYLEQNRELVGPNRDPFAHFLQAGTYRDVDPSPAFGSAIYRRAHLGRATRHFRATLHPDTDNPLIHHLHATYR